MRLLSALWAHIIGYYGFGARSGLRRRRPAPFGYPDRRLGRF